MKTENTAAIDARKVREVVVVSGKGGTGKTTVAASLADRFSDAVVVDADVDAANLHILMKPVNIESYDFIGKPVAFIEQDRCSGCGQCKEMCRFDAVINDSLNGSFLVDPNSCEGCTLCKVLCPVNAITMEKRVAGQWSVADTEQGDFVHARLIPGAENSGSLVSIVRRHGKETAEKKDIPTPVVLIDGPPGIGCPLTAAAAGADLAVVVTEPSHSGFSDLERIIDLLEHFKIKSGIVINRFDINPAISKKIEAFAGHRKIPVFARIPHSMCVVEAISNSAVPSRLCPQLAEAVDSIYSHICTELKLQS
jgi:MinD superfamily P-loop ATPase